MIRGAIRDFFPERSCCVFPRPADEDKLKELDKLPDSDLLPAFRAACDIFLKEVKLMAKTKRMSGAEVNGPAFASLAEQSLGAVLSKDICLESMFANVAKQENKRLIEVRLKILHGLDLVHNIQNSACRKLSKSHSKSYSQS